MQYSESSSQGETFPLVDGNSCPRGLNDNVYKRFPKPVKRCVERSTGRFPNRFSKIALGRIPGILPGYLTRLAVESEQLSSRCKTTGCLLQMWNVSKMSGDECEAGEAARQKP